MVTGKRVASGLPACMLMGVPAATKEEVKTEGELETVDGIDDGTRIAPCSSCSTCESCRSVCDDVDGNLGSNF